MGKILERICIQTALIFIVLSYILIVMIFLDSVSKFGFINAFGAFLGLTFLSILLIKVFTFHPNNKGKYNIICLIFGHEFALYGEKKECLCLRCEVGE